MSRAPALTRLFTLETPEDAADGGGGRARSWRSVGAHWAALRAVSAAEAVAHGAQTRRVTHRAVIRWASEGSASRPGPAQRFREGDRVFDIVAVAEADDGRRFLDCWLVEGRLT